MGDEGFFIEVYDVVKLGACIENQGNVAITS
jgi:hypothetical protein